MNKNILKNNNWKSSRIAAVLLVVTKFPDFARFKSARVRVMPTVLLYIINIFIYTRLGTSSWFISLISLNHTQSRIN